MANLVRVSIHGTMPSGEVWSVNPVYRANTNDVITGTESQAAAVAIAALTLPTGLRSFLSDGTSWTGVRVEARQLDGTLESQGEALRATPVSGLVQARLPFQCAAVISLRGLGGGARQRGRLYWPATGAIIDVTSHRFTAASLTTFLNDAKTFLTNVGGALEAHIDDTFDLAVWSRTGAAIATVATIKAGDVVDTQRRRRDTVPETYQEVTYFTP